VPPIPAFLEPARAVGCTNSEPDGDGVMRRPWTHLAVGNKFYPYLGLQIALQELETPEERVEAVLHPDSLEIVRFGRADGARRGEVRLPLDAEGRLLVNWAGNSRRNRRGKEEYFVHLPFARLVQFYQTRYDVLDKNVRTILDKLTDEEREAVGAEKYRKASDRFQDALVGRKEIPIDEARTLEERLDRQRGKMIQEFSAFITAIDERLPKITSPRAREGALKTKAEWVQYVASSRS
jgi:hypothetical protein